MPALNSFLSENGILGTYPVHLIAADSMPMPQKLARERKEHIEQADRAFVLLEAEMTEDRQVASIFESAKEKDDVRPFVNGYVKGYFVRPRLKSVNLTLASTASLVDALVVALWVILKEEDTAQK